MNKYILVLCIPLFIFAQSFVPKLKYIDHFDRPMTSYKEWSETIFKEAFSLDKAYHTGHDNFRQQLIDIVVYAPIYLNILEGYTVQVDTVRGWTAEELRTHFAGLLSSDLVGAVLIGSVPFAWYEMSSAEGREEFPIELYLMDLDGNWIDSDGNGLFDDHTGNKAPEIWVGRISASPMTWGNEIYLTNNYLSKIHKYRTGGYNISQKALAYVDDDWYSFGDCSLDYLYDTVVVVRQYNTTVAADFRTRLNDPYEWVQICSHSSPWGNTFKYTGGYAGTVFNFELWFSNPPWLFSNLFQCSGTRFFEENYCGGCYIFGPQNGLLTIGSAKVGSMLHFDDFYGPLNTGISVGEAFKQWFAQWGITDPSWFYGMCICGDPVLKPKQSDSRFVRYWKRKKPHFDVLSGWSEPEPVDLDPESDGYVTTTTDGAGRIWAGWVTGRSNSNGRTEICAAYRLGGFWSSPQIIDPFVYWDFFPALTCDTAGRAVLSWSRCYGRNYDIFLSSYDGSNWGSPYRVSSKATDALHPAMTVDGDARLWVTMERWNHLNGDIYCRYHDGTSWQSMFAVTVNSANDYKPSMATDSTGKAWTAWSSERWEENRNIYVKNYNAASGHWENLQRITSNPDQDQDPKVCVDGSGTVWVAWTTWRHGNSDIYESHFDGTSWTPPRPVSTDSSSDQHCALAVDQDGFVWCIWQSDRTGDWEIAAKYFKDDSWQGLANISNSTYMDILPAATLDDSGNIWVLFQTDRNDNWDIYASFIFSDLLEPQVTVIVPNGGEVWNIGDTDTIRWVATDNSMVDSVSIFYSTNSGTDWIEISHGEPNDSIYEWLVPPTPSTECLVKVVAFDQFPNSAEDVSDGLFTIRDGIPPEVTLYYPNGGEIFYTGDIDTIRWSATDNIGVDSVSLEFSADSGNTWHFIANPQPLDSTYEWTIPDVHSTECLVRVRAFDAGDNMGEDISDSLFSILDDTPPDISVIVPNGGEIWYWNEVHTIEWNSQDNVGIDSLDVHLSLDGGATYPVLITHITGNDSTYDWTIPETTSYDCLIKVTGYDMAGNVNFDVSDSLFAIGELGIEEILGIPKHFSVSMLSSNPFMGKFIMKLAVPHTMPVKISVFDVQGRLIKYIVNNKLERGYHILSWYNKNIPSGIYFLHIKTEDIEKTEKIIKLR
jgi:hypothetical protein